jgi:hypothetical protein
LGWGDPLTNPIFKPARSKLFFKLIGLRVMFGQTQSMLYCAKLYYPVSASWLLGAIPEFHGSTLKIMTVIKRYIF